jgi:hypothetical protein
VATDVVKDAHSITAVRYVLDNDTKEGFLFYRPTNGRAALLDVFSITNDLLEEDEINWKNCSGLCTD